MGAVIFSAARDQVGGCGHRVTGDVTGSGFTDSDAGPAKLLDALRGDGLMLGAVWH